MHPLPNKRPARGRPPVPSLPSSQQPGNPPKRHSGRPRPQTKVQFHQPTRPPAQRLASHSQGTKPTCRPTFNNRRFRFPAERRTTIPVETNCDLVSSCISLSWRHEDSCFFLHRNRWRNLRLRRLDRLAPPPLSLPPGEVPTLQRQRWHSGWVRLSLIKSWRTPAAQPGAEGPPVQLNMGKPPLSHQVTRPNSPTCPLVMMTRITRRHDPAVLLKGLSAHLSDWRPVSLRLLGLALLHPG